MSWRPLSGVGACGGVRPHFCNVDDNKLPQRERRWMNRDNRIAVVGAGVRLMRRLIG